MSFRASKGGVREGLLQRSGHVSDVVENHCTVHGPHEDSDMLPATQGMWVISFPCDIHFSWMTLPNMRVHLLQRSRRRPLPS